MDYTIITAWYDVREKEENELKNDQEMRHFCTTSHYFSSAKKLFNKAFPLVIFTEPKYEEMIWNSRPKDLHPLTRVIVRDYSELSQYCLFKKYEENHKTNVIYNLDVKKFTSLYKFLVIQKPDFVKQVAMMNPFNSSKFAWMDMRLHCVYDMSVEETNKSFISMHRDRVKMLQMDYTHPEEVENRKNFYEFTRGKIAAGFFGGYRECLIKFANLCKNELEYCVDNGFAPSDEMLFSYIVGKNPDLFDPYFGDYCSVLKNQLYSRERHYLAHNFLAVSFSKGNHFYTAKASDSIRIAYLKNELDLSGKDIHDTWYYGYVANYWLNNKEKCIILIEELYEIACIKKDLESHIRSVFEPFKHMISYIGNESLVNKFDKFK